MANRSELHASHPALSPKEEPSKAAGRRPRRRTATNTGRRGQRGKRRGPGERRGGPGERGGGPGERRRGLKEKKRQEEQEGVTVKRTWSDGKRRWDKKHYCVFCRRPQVKIARHLLRKHADQQEVAAASELPTGSKQRHLLLEHLRCRGNYMHNIEVIRQGSGEIVPWRQPSEEVDARNYLPCPLCLGFFLRADLWKHQASCRKKMTSDPSKDSASTAQTTSDTSKDTTSDPGRKPACDQADDGTSSCPGHTPPDPTRPSDTGTKRPMTSDPNVDQNLTSGVDQPRKRTRVQAAASRLLPISSGASESCSEVLHRMNQDHVSHQVKSDWLICKYGNKLMGNQDGSQRRYDYVSQKLRELGRFLLAAKSLDSGVGSLQDLLAPGRLSLVLTAARKAAGYRWSRPPLAVKTTLKTVCEIAIGESLQDGDWEAAAKTTDFYHLLGREWDNLGLLDQEPDTGARVAEAKLKRRPVQSGEPSQETPNPRPDAAPSRNHSRPDGTTTPPESRLQGPITVPVASRKVRRRPWSSAEKEAVWRQLGVHVLVQSVPGKEVCQRCLDLEPVLRGRHWKDIKNQVHNQIQSQKKQHFHAQMDLQENEEQDHSQKKQLCQAHLDQHEEDNSQNQKKQQCHIQVDLQDHNNIQSMKKHTLHTQMGHEDHLHIHKQQLCHGRPDHQHHSQVYKKQLYQRGELANLDRDPSVMTGPLYGPDGPQRAPGQSLLERDPIGPYPLPHRTMGAHMGQLPRTEWTDESLVQHYSHRQMDRHLHQDPPAGLPASPHSGPVHF